MTLSHQCYLLQCRKNVSLEYQEKWRSVDFQQSSEQSPVWFKHMAGTGKRGKKREAAKPNTSYVVTRSVCSQWCQDPRTLFEGPYLSQLNYWCVSSDLWAMRSGVAKERLGPGRRWPQTTWLGHGGWQSDCGVITGHSKLVLGCIRREGEGKTVGGWPIRSHRMFQGGSSWRPVSFPRATAL